MTHAVTAADHWCITTESCAIRVYFETSVKRRGSPSNNVFYIEIYNEYNL